MKTTLDTAMIIHEEQALRQATGQAFYNTSPFTLRDLTTHASQQRFTADFEATISGKRCVVEYELDTNLRDTEQVPLLEEGGVEAFLRREVLPHAGRRLVRRPAKRLRKRGRRRPRKRKGPS